MKTSIYQEVERIKQREKKELVEAVKKHGKEHENGFMIVFDKEDRPIIAGYIDDEPCDITIRSVEVDNRDHLTLRDLYGNKIYPNNIFAGHLDFVTSTIFSKTR